MGMPVMLELSEHQDAVIIGEQKLEFSVLSTLLKRIHEFAVDLVAWRVEDDSTN
jgi:hypothetical protein